MKSELDVIDFHISFGGFVMKAVARVVNPDRHVSTHIGDTPSISATKGAGIVIIRAPILQKPIDVIVKRVGKSKAFPR